MIFSTLLQVLEAARTGLSAINASIAASSSGGYFRPPGESAREVYKASCPEVPDKIVDKAADVVEELARGVEEWGARVAPDAISQEYAAVSCPWPTGCMQPCTAGISTATDIVCFSFLLTEGATQPHSQLAGM